MDCLIQHTAFSRQSLIVKLVSLMPCSSDCLCFLGDYLFRHRRGLLRLTRADGIGLPSPVLQANSYSFNLQASFQEMLVTDKGKKKSKQKLPNAANQPQIPLTNLRENKIKSMKGQNNPHPGPRALV